MSKEQVIENHADNQENGMIAPPDAVAGGCSIDLGTFVVIATVVAGGVAKMLAVIVVVDDGQKREELWVQAELNQ